MFAVDPLAAFLGASFDHHQSAEPDFWYDATAEYDLDARIGDLEQTLAAANELTGLTRARNEYGFLGLGQTVAVIDSGIAWDHPNLGGGFGSDYRVVGGWDFSEENDANPYDDGPAGAHGTHVAGIVGATIGPTGDEGVAPGVDLVGLRVFNDQGAGYFGWVEKALRWVHTNRDAFANPITAVNLSLGTAWNAATVPSWSMLEDELAQLKADGIFVSVSAGNSFSTYKTPGLSYPAASASVVPVMSVDDNGALSYFSQRHSRAIAAPGRTVRSTVPDYVGNQNGQTDDWASFSGTSMAAPYVAGASVLLREAMQFVGYTNITQDTIYDHMLSTADEVFDAATNALYKRLNVGAALDALMSVDDFGSVAADAFDLGVVGTAGKEVSGTISGRSDVDYFQFTATTSGTVTFAATTTHYLAASWIGDGVASDDGLTYTIRVEAGESYTVGLGTTGGIGHFALAITTQTSFEFVDWGAVSQQLRTGVGVSGESWYCVTAEQAGYLTAEAFYSANCQVELAWFNANFEQVASGAVSTLAAESQRVDRYVNSGEQLFLRVSGSGDGVDVRLTNLVSIEDGTLLVSATDGDDSLAFTAGSTTHEVMVNGVTYRVDSAEVQSIRIDAGGGRDAITITGTASNETATLRSGFTEVRGGGYSVAVVAAENVLVEGGGGTDSVTLYDTAGNDKLTARPQDLLLELANANSLQVTGFLQTRVDASRGHDTAEVFDSAGDDTYAAWSNRIHMTDGTFVIDARNFDRTLARSFAGGADRAALYDSAGDDVYAAFATRAYLSGEGFFNDTQGFSRTTALATAGGNDRAVFEDSAGDDVYVATPTRTYLVGSGFFNDATGFDRTTAYASTGNDRAEFHDSAGNDEYAAWSDRAVIYGAGYWNDARNFDRTNAFATSGNDKAVFYDTPDDDVYMAWSDRAVLFGGGYFNDARGFDRTSALASGGNDRAIFYDSVGDDVYSAWSDRATLYGAGYSNDARGFDQTVAHATAGGNDRAVLNDSAGQDLLMVRAWGASLSGTGYFNETRGFRQVTGQMVNGGVNTADLKAVDYLFHLIGEWI
jgi:subtilisin family serine protease